MSGSNNSVLTRIFARVFPSMPDFFGLLREQCQHVSRSAGLLIEFMETGSPDAAERCRQDEHDADQIKARNVQVLAEAFSTPIDREDLHRAINDLDEIVNYFKSTVNEMDALGVTPDKFSLEMAMHIKAGVDALDGGFSRLEKEPAAAMADAIAAKKCEKKVEKAYRRAISELFQGEDYIRMFKQREVYRHLSNAADRMANCANSLQDIVVKLS
jgi:uncharacterized protein Yka (UPF0111/DUF47 family)